VSGSFICATVWAKPLLIIHYKLNTVKNNNNKKILYINWK
jgi:hypothetical protein